MTSPSSENIVLVADPTKTLTGNIFDGLSGHLGGLATIGDLIAGAELTLESGSTVRVSSDGSITYTPSASVASGDSETFTFRAFESGAVSLTEFEAAGALEVMELNETWLNLAGDVNGDGLADLIVADGETEQNFGWAHIVLGDGNTPDLNFDEDALLTGSSIELIHEGHVRVIGVMSLGDLNGDGYDDVGIHWSHDLEGPGQPDGSAVLEVFFGSAEFDGSSSILI